MINSHISIILVVLSSYIHDPCGFVIRYPDATPEELGSGDNVCIICREEMTSGCKKLPCNHIFHTSCLRSWFQRQQSCPTCRLEVLRMPRPAAAAPAPAPQQQPQQQQQAPQDNMQNPFQNSELRDDLMSLILSFVSDH